MVRDIDRARYHYITEALSQPGTIRDWPTLLAVIKAHNPEVDLSIFSLGSFNIPGTSDKFAFGNRNRWLTDNIGISICPITKILL